MFAIAKRTIRDALDDNITGEAAKAAYYIFFSIFPLILASFALTGLVGGARAFVWIMERVETLAPGQGGEILEGFVAEITQQQRFDALSIGLLLAIWAGSNFFAALGQGLDAMFDVREKPSFVRRRGKALLMLFVGGALLVAGATVILLGPVAVDRFGLGTIAAALRWPLGFALIAAQMWLMYYILPNRDQRHIRRELAIGAAVATTVWILATGAFSLYVQNFANYDQTYGAVGAVIVLMLWLFITALAVLLGGEVAHVLEERRHGSTAPDEAGRERNTDRERDDDEPRRLRSTTSRDAAHVVRADTRGERPRIRPKARVRHEQERPVQARIERVGNGRWGTPLALQQRTDDGTFTHRQRRQHMAVERNDDPGMGAGMPGPGMGDPRGGAYDRGERSESLRDTGESIRQHGDETVDRVKREAIAAADTGRNRIAGKLEELGDRLEERGREAEGRGGVQQRAGQAAVKAGHALDEGADYLRSHDVDAMRGDLERQIREKPLMSVGIAIGAGFLLARLLRD